MNGTSIGFFVALLGLTVPVLAGAEQPAPELKPIVIDQAPPELRDVTSRLWTVVFSPNGKTLAVTAGWDNPREPGELVLWDVATRQTKLIWRQEATIRTAAFSGDGKLLAIGDFAGATRLLDPSTGKIILTFPKHSKLVNSVAFTPGDKTLVTGSFDQTIKLWDVASGKEQHVLSLPDEDIVKVAISSDSRMLAAVTWPGKAHVWDLTRREELHLLQASQGDPGRTQIAEAVLKLMRAAGLRTDAVRLLPGDHSTAHALASREYIDAVTITGSVAAGYAMQEICARRMIPLQAELNGNNAAIVWDDADLADAAKQLAWGAFGFAGQRCTANRRVIVSRVLFAPFLDELKAAGEQLVWGDPLDQTCDIGPVVNFAKRDETAELVNRARADKSVHAVEMLHQAQAQEAWVSAGAFAQPAILCCDHPEHPLVQEETMSPLVVIQRAENFEHALALSNGTRYGLAAALFSSVHELQQQFLESAQAGILKINTSTAGADISLPFGGWKGSGLGPPEHGDGDRLFYTRMQAVYGRDR